MKALVVDDSSTMRKVLRSILSGAGFEVVEAKCGFEAMVCFANHHPELALLDWNMPEMSGYELLKKVRSEAIYNDIKIMMVTTESEQTEVERAILAGANEYVMKPFSKESILSKLEMLGYLP